MKFRKPYTRIEMGFHVIHSMAVGVATDMYQKTMVILKFDENMQFAFGHFTWLCRTAIKTSKI